MSVKQVYRKINLLVAIGFMVFNATFNNIAVNVLNRRRGRDRMVVRFTTTYAIGAYHH
jgi:hypothetical protein